MTKEQFLKLKAGDVVLFGKHRHPRIVHQGPADGHRSVAFAIKRRSWTGRAYTVYGFTDLRMAGCRLARRVNLRSLCLAERDELRSLGFDVEQEIRREVAAQERLNQAWGRPADRALRRMKAALRREASRVR